MRALQANPENICYFDITNQTIINTGKTIQLSVKAFALLKYLYDYPDQLITKQQLLDKIWCETITVEAVIKNIICEIRRALQDPPRKSNYVQTIHRRGYRFIGSNKLIAVNQRPTTSTDSMSKGCRQAVY